jgi:hypothetical protein
MYKMLNNDHYTIMPPQDWNVDLLLIPCWIRRTARKKPLLVLCGEREALFSKDSLRARWLEDASHNASLKLIGADANALIAPLSDARTLGTIEICSVITQHAQGQ